MENNKELEPSKVNKISLSSKATPAAGILQKIAEEDEYEKLSFGEKLKYKKEKKSEDKPGKKEKVKVSNVKQKSKSDLQEETKAETTINASDNSEEPIQHVVQKDRTINSFASSISSFSDTVLQMPDMKTDSSVTIESVSDEYFEDVVIPIVSNTSATPKMDDSEYYEDEPVESEDCEDDGFAIPASIFEVKEAKTNSAPVLMEEYYEDQAPLPDEPEYDEDSFVIPIPVTDSSPETVYAEDTTESIDYHEPVNEESPASSVITPIDDEQIDLKRNAFVSDIDRYSSDKATIDAQKKEENPLEKMRRRQTNAILFRLAVQIAVILIFFCFIVRNTVVVSASMEPTLMTGDFVIYNKLAYKITDIQRGDIITFYSSEYHENMSKRVIGISGDKIEFHDGYVFINGLRADESAYLSDDVETNSNKSFEVPEGYVFVLGDNRQNSYDSRFFMNPYISISDIVGKYIGTVHKFW